MLAVEGLCKRFGGFLAVNQVSFDVREGEILGLIGPNGSGKSTTFNLIAGNLQPTAGSIRFAGKEIGGLPAHEICHQGIARTFQIPRPFRKLSLRENVALAAFYGEAGGISRDEATQRAKEALEIVGVVRFELALHWVVGSCHGRSHTGRQLRALTYKVTGALR